MSRELSLIYLFISNQIASEMLSKKESSIILLSFIILCVPLLIQELLILNKSITLQLNNHHI